MEFAMNDPFVSKDTNSATVEDVFSESKEGVFSDNLINISNVEERTQSYDKPFVLGNPRQTLREAFERLIAQKIVSISSGATKVVTGFVTGVIRSVANIISQAVKMALFKFGIELCAMGIKGLVESMTSMKLTPPNIDTKGVSYNFNTNSSTTTSSGYNNSYGSRGNFSDPFATPSPFPF